MNRSILIIICDFLLLSLLTFSTDLSKIAGQGEQPTATVAVATNQVEQGGQDLAAVMKQALEEERKSHQQLQAELARARAGAEQQQQLLGERDQRARQLQKQEADLRQRFAAAQTRIQSLNQELQNSSAEASASREKLAAIQAEDQKQSDLAAALQRQLAQLASSNQVVLAEKQQLASRLQVAEVEKRAAAEQAALMQKQVQVQSAENARLAEGVKALATNSGALAREIRENRALAPNTIFNEFVSNRVQAAFYAYRTGFLGVDSTKDKTTETILVSDGTNIFALCHVQDTPLTLWSPGKDWTSLTGTLEHSATDVPIQSLSFDLQDPRVVFMPVTPAQARSLGCNIYRISSDPYKFQDAVVVGAQAGYYGECNFQIDLDTPQYVKLDHSLWKGLFGKFNPSRGDMVFSRNGELLGIMVNSTYCLTIHRFAAAATFQFGRDVRAQHTGTTLSQLFSYVFQLPVRLQ
ncbi:MAG: hypothetical protein KGJ60_06960 [Verrucomicrobiota bacterium]|nr:hypothetical protein [Verrucomicrobiota bacterium]